MNPMQVAQNRTARLVREATTPTYSTSTPAREHLMMVEVETDTGYRHWATMRESQVDTYVSEIHPSDGLSDIDHSAKCWCQ
jgi:hypothetical protein